MDRMMVRNRLCNVIIKQFTIANKKWQKRNVLWIRTIFFYGYTKKMEKGYYTSEYSVAPYIL